jgi:hypothetical protein
VIESRGDKRGEEIESPLEDVSNLQPTGQKSERVVSKENGRSMGEEKRTDLRFQPAKNSLSSTSLCRSCSWSVGNPPKKILSSSFTKTRAIVRNSKGELPDTVEDQLCEVKVLSIVPISTRQRRGEQHGECKCSMAQ